MKTVIFLSLFGFVIAVAQAADLRREDLIARLQIRADVLILSADGKQMIGSGGERRTISGFSPEGKYKRDWSSKGTNEEYRLRHEWRIDDKGAIHVKFEEFAEEELDSKTGLPKDFKNPIGTEEHEVVDFGPVLYRVKAMKGKRVVIRFIPELSNEAEVEKIEKFKLLGQGITVYDAEGAVWASGLELNSEYSAISTHRGTLALSYSPFKGAEPVGVASGKTITIRMKNYPRINLQSETDFVPTGLNARVFVAYLKDRRTGGLNSVNLHESSKEKRFVDWLK